MAEEFREPGGKIYIPGNTNSDQRRACGPRFEMPPAVDVTRISARAKSLVWQWVHIHKEALSTRTWTALGGDEAGETADNATC